MNIFLSWSGQASKELALALHGWFPCVMQTSELLRNSICSDNRYQGACSRALPQKRQHACT